MFSRSFLVNQYKMDTIGGTIQWNGEEVKTSGHLISLGDEYSLAVYFVKRGNGILPASGYLQESKTAIMFAYEDEMDAYKALVKSQEPVYGYFNTESPELNALSIDEPFRDWFVKTA